MTNVVEKAKFPPRILAGIQPTTSVNIGHYFGAIKQQIRLHHQYPGCSFFMVADYHSMTRGIDREKITNGTLELATILLALGLDPSKATLFRQSNVSGIAELNWLLLCLTKTSELLRNPAYKELGERIGGTPNAGVLTYPVLMAADVLALRANILPVGADQAANTDKVRVLIKRVNKLIGYDYFPIPQTEVVYEDPIPGLDGTKMRSERNNDIPLFCRFNKLKERVNKIATLAQPVNTPKDPEECTVFKLYKLVADDDSISNYSDKYTSGLISYSQMKRELVQAIQEYFSEYEERYYELKSEPDYVDSILHHGIEQASMEAQKSIDLLRSEIGYGV